MVSSPTDYDSPWKEALQRFFEPFMAFFFPTAHAGIASSAIRCLAAG